MVEVQKIFDVVYGVNLELNKLEIDPKGINFVSRTAKNNGVSAKVKKYKSLEPTSGGVITVAGGGSVMESFLQKEPFYSGRDLYYLKPKIELSDQEMLYYCICLRANKYRFNYGRQANRTLKYLLIPEKSEIPEWVLNYDIDKMLTEILGIKEVIENGGTY
ncbi:restriction endonuclease subunit S [uncultured Winogradskyella sp.]|jgi:hypothetical protein|uniref:restriction endonuclease subunit S n=1 Tax=uncultured Winogradskyella sp. TaxID=395353 RepID=UPI00262DC4D9|nr:restriction endonuclease subunit S [uncultured Winogradskyella sp.]